MDDFTASDEVNAPVEVWSQRLSERIEEIVDRKRSSVQGRETALHNLSYMLMAHYARDILQTHATALVPAILKSVKSGQSDKETVLALKALALVIITDPDETACESALGPIKLAIEDSDSTEVKTAALHILGLATFYGGVADSEIQETMTYLVDIVESDGAVIGAEDSGAVVTCALEEWAFLATQLDDMEDASNEPIEAFVEQLESADVGVQIAAGEAIALLYEKSYTELEDDEELERKSQVSDDDAPDSNAIPMVKRYTVYDNDHQLRTRLSELAKSSGHRMSKRDKRSLHTSFADILNSVEHPTRGPRWSKALNAETGKAYGSRLAVGVGGKNSLRIRTWEQLHRLKALRRVLQGGFLVHYADNVVVFDTLPVMLHPG